MKRLFLLSALTVVVAAHAAEPTHARLAFDPKDGDIRLPSGFRAVVVADNLGSLRFMAVGPAGDVYVKTRTGGIVALRDADGDGRAEVKEVFGSGGGTGIAVHNGWLYHSTDNSVLRYKLTAGELVPKGAAEIVVESLSDERQHDAKSFAFDDAGRLYVEVGSPSNAYGDPDRALGAKGKDPTEFLRTHGGFWRFDPDRLAQQQADGYHYSTGQRHVLAIAWNPTARAFFVVMQGRDQLTTVDPVHYTEDDNAELPAEELHLLREGGSLGWPFTYWDPLKRARMLAPEYGGDNSKKAESGKYPDPLVAFPAHWSPLQMAFYSGTQFPAKYRGGAFIAFHGSWNRAPKPQKGYKVVFIPFDEHGMPRGTYEVFADGFAGAPEIASPNDARFRPCGLAVGPEGSLYVADSQKGRVWRIVYAGERPVAAPIAPKPRASATPDDAGARLYRQSCAACHMADGGGVPGMQPSLKGSRIVAGDPVTLIRLLLRGPAVALPATRERYTNTMPAFVHLSDSEIASLLTYVRRRFGPAPSAALVPGQVTRLRAQP